MSIQVEILENRIRSNQARGRSIVNDSGIQTLFVKLTEMHAAVLARMQTLDDERSACPCAVSISPIQTTSNRCKIKSRIFKKRDKRSMP